MGIPDYWSCCMKNFILLILISLLLPIYSFGADAYGNVRVSRIVSVYDGDTFRADIAEYPAILGRNIGVRLNHVDTPEMKDKDPEIRKLAVDARDFVIQKFGSAKVIELKNIERGKYFRIVADVYLDGVSLADLLLKNKMGLPYDGGAKTAWKVSTKKGPSHD